MSTIGEVLVGGIVVLGRPVDAQTRCVHYASELDVVAIRFACCGEWYPCVHCHDETVDHERKVWAEADAAEEAVLCGACATRLSIADYREATRCPACSTAFNPGCRMHHPLYFA